MEILTSIDWQYLHKFLLVIYSPCHLDEFPGQILTALPKLIGAELFGAASFSTEDIILPRIRTFPNPEIGIVAESFTAKRQNFFAHPASYHYVQTNDGQALAISDFFSELEFHRQEPLYSGFFQHLGLEDQLLIHFELPFKLNTGIDIDPFHKRQEHLALSASRNRRSFTEHDRLILNLIRSHLKQAYENVVTFNHLHHQLAKQQKAIEQAALISLSIDGKVKWATQKAEEILHRYFSLSCVQVTLPEFVQRWVNQQIFIFFQSPNDISSIRPLTFELNGRRLKIRFSCSIEREQFYLLLEEDQPNQVSIEALQILGLTKREAEVLFWVAKDQSTQEIAKRLEMSDRTVKKHMENIYKKFNVQTRLGAVMYALKNLGIANL